MAFEVLFCQLGLQTSSKGNMFYIGRLSLVEPVDFGFWIISIRICMQKLEPSQCIPVKDKKLTPEPDTYTIDA